MLDKHLTKASDGPLERAQMMKADGDFSGARALLESSLVTEPDNILYLTELAELRALDGDVDGAKAELARLQGIEPNHASVKRLAALLNFSDVVAAYPDVRSLRARVAANAGDPELRHALAVHQLLGGDVEPALHTWLQMMRTHRGYQDDLARRSLLQALELIGAADPIVARTRKEMARLLF
jgi:putative thioredoxin